MTKIFITGCHSPVNRLEALVKQQQVPTDQVHVLGEIKTDRGRTAWLDALEYRKGISVPSLINGKGYFIEEEDMLPLLEAILPRITCPTYSHDEANDIGVTKKILIAFARAHYITVYVCGENPEGHYAIPGVDQAIPRDGDGLALNEAERQAAANR